jgi:hypothetical protein
MSDLLVGQLDPRIRDLMLEVWDGDRRVLPHLHRMENVVRLEEVLVWLVRQRITGSRFIGWLKEEQGGSLLKAISFILQKVNRDLVARPLIHGKDIV